MSAPKPLDQNLVTTREMLALGDAVVYSIAEVEAACAAVDRQIEYFFQLPESNDLCGPYRSIEEAKADTAYGKWKLFWRYRAIPPGSAVQVDYDAIDAARKEAR